MSTNTFISLSQGLEQNIRKATNELGRFNGIAEKINSSFSGIYNKTSNLDEAFSGIEKKTKEFSKFEGFGKKLESSTDKAKDFNESLDEINNSFEDSIDYQKKIIESQERNTKEVKKTSVAISLMSAAIGKVSNASSVLRESFGKIAAEAGSVVKVLVGGIGALSFADSVGSALSLNQEILDLSFRMSHGAKGARELEKSIYEVSDSTGVASENVSSMFKSLMNMKVPIENLKNLSKEAVLFEQITGADNFSVKQMTGNLVVMGKLGEESISSIMKSMVHVQREFGISETEVTHLTDRISETTKVLKNMGKTSSEIEKFHKGTMKLAGAFASVGIKAEEATSIVDRLLDPGRLEDNAFLYSKLGISISDAINGNIDPEQITSGLQKIGGEVQKMAGPQANALAKALNIPLQELRQMGNIDMKKTTDSFSKLNSESKSLSEYQKDQEGPQRKMEQVWNRVKSAVGDISMKFLNFVEPAVSFISKNMNKVLESVIKISKSEFVTNIAKEIKNFIKSIDFSKVEKGISSIINSVKGHLNKVDFSNIGESMSKTLGKIKTTTLNVFEFIKKIVDPKTLVVGFLAILTVISLFKKQFASGITDIAENFVKKMKRSSSETGSDLTNIIRSAVSDGLNQGVEKSNYVKKYRKANDLAVAEASERVKEGHEYAFRAASAEYQKVFGERKMFSWAKKLNENTVEWMDTLAKGSQPISMFTSFYDKTQKSTLEQSKLTKAKYESEKSYLEGIQKQLEESIEGHNARKAILDGRINQLEEINKKEKNGVALSSEEQETKKKLLSLQKDDIKEKDYINGLLGKNGKLLNQDLEIKQKIAEVDSKIKSESEKYINSLGPEGIDLRIKELEAEKSSLNSKIDSLKYDGEELKYKKGYLELIEQELKSGNLSAHQQAELNDELKETKSYIEKVENSRIGSLTTEKNLLEKSKTMLDNRKRELQLKIDSGNFTEDEVIDLKKINNLISENNSAMNEVNSEMKRATDEAEEYKNQLLKINEQLDDAVGASKKIELGDSERTKGFGNKVKALSEGIKTNLSVSFKEIGEKVSNSMKVAGTTLKTALNPKNLLINKVREVGGGNWAKGAAKIGGKVAKGAVKVGVGTVKKIGSGVRKIGSIGSGVRNVAMMGGALAVGVLGRTDKGKELINKVQEKLSNALEKLNPYIDKLISKIEPLIDGMFNFLSPAIDGLGKVFESFMPKMKSVFEWITKFFTEKGGSIIKIVGSLISAAISLVKPFIPVLGKIGETILKLVPPFMNVLSFFMNFLGNFISGLGSVFSAIGLKSIGDGMKAVGDGMKTAANKMNESADKIRESMNSHLQPLEDNRVELINNKNKLEFYGKNLKLSTEAKSLSDLELGKAMGEVVTKENRASIERMWQISAMEKNTKALIESTVEFKREQAAKKIAKAAVEAAEKKEKEIREQIFEKTLSTTGFTTGFTAGTLEVDKRSVEVAFAETLKQEADNLSGGLASKNGFDSGEIIKEIKNSFIENGDFSKVFDGTYSEKKQLTIEEKKILSNSGMLSPDLLLKVNQNGILNRSEKAQLEIAYNTISDKTRRFIELNTYGTKNSKDGKNIRKSVDKEFSDDKILSNLSQEIQAAFKSLDPGDKKDFWEKIKKANGNEEKIGKAIIELQKDLAGKDAFLDSTYKEQFNNMANPLMEQIKKMDAGTEKDGLIRGLEEIMKDSDKSYEQKMSELFNFFRKNESAWKSMETVQSDKYKALIKQMEENAKNEEKAKPVTPVPPTNNGSGTTETTGSITRTLAPAILEATSTGFARIQEMSETVSGLSKTEQEERKITLANDTLVETIKTREILEKQLEQAKENEAKLQKIVESSRATAVASNATT